jgi:heme/copper-type cytochrome/quinol oxidase subunit 2
MNKSYLSVLIAFLVGLVVCQAIIIFDLDWRRRTAQEEAGQQWAEAQKCHILYEPKGAR